jgi:hypothetical protein
MSDISLAHKLEVASQDELLKPDESGNIPIKILLFVLKMWVRPKYMWLVTLFEFIIKRGYIPGSDFNKLIELIKELEGTKFNEIKDKISDIASKHSKGTGTGK